MNNDKETKDILREILRWTKFQAMQKAKGVLEAALDNDAKKSVYELSDGKSSSAISKIVKVSDQTVRNYWKEWAVLGIAEIHPGYKKRFRRVFSLKEVGIEVPQIEETTASESAKEGENVDE